MISKLEQIKYEIALFSDNKFGKERPFTAPLQHLKLEADEAIESGELEEFCDILLLLLDAFRKKFPDLSTDDLLSECRAKIKICEKRKYHKPDKNGIIEHIREGEKDNFLAASYYEDMENYESSFSCTDCGNQLPSNFTYERTVANGEVWLCKSCGKEILVDHEPNADNY